MGKKSKGRAGWGLPAFFLGFLFFFPLFSAASQGGEARVRMVLEGLLARKLDKKLEAAWNLARLPGPAWKTLVRRLAGTGAALAARIRGLVRRLGAERWEDREEAEKELVQLGRRAMGFLENARKEAPLLEVRWRAARALKRIRQASPRMEKKWEKEMALSRALAWALMVFPPRDPERVKQATRILETARFDPDRELRYLSLRALARLKDPQAEEPLTEVLEKGGAMESLLALEGLLDLGSPRAVAEIRALSAGEKKPLFGLAARGALLLRGLVPPPWKGPGFLAPSFDSLSGPGKGAASPPWKVVLTTGEVLTGGVRGMDGSGLLVDWKGRGRIRIPVTLLSWAEPGGAAGGKEPGKGGSPGREGGLDQWILFRSGTYLPGKILALGENEVEVELSLLGKRSLPRSAVLAWGPGDLPGTFPGLVPGRDGITLADGRRVAGKVLRFAKEGIQIRLKGGKKETFPLGAIRGFSSSFSLWEKKLFPGSPLQTLLSHSWELRGGGMVKAFLLALRGKDVLLVDPFLGPLRIPLDRVKSVRFRTGLGKGMGLTLVSDLDESRIVEFNGRGKVVWTFKDLDGGPLDAAWLPGGNLLVCEEGGRVREITREGKTVWEMKGLSLPYAAQKLSNGNYLIADTGHKRVIEVTPAGKITWTFKNVTPYDVQRLSNGNTLIADGGKDRVIEVDRAGRIVWSVGGMPEVRDADRLPNGDTLIACWGNSAVVEVNPGGKVVWKLTNLETPSDADRLPGGLTLVAESGRVRVVDWQGKTVWSVPVGWAVEANRY